jgi:hypothetical protein
MSALWLAALPGLLTLAVAGCGPSAPAKSVAAERVVNVYNGYDYITRMRCRRGGEYAPQAPFVAMWIDTAAIVADAPRADNALRLINFLNAASQPLIDRQLANALIYPHGAHAARLIPERLRGDAFVRLRTRMWTRFRAGQ